jgi:hypothetical protein
VKRTVFRGKIEIFADTRIWSAVAEVAPRAWIYHKGILATADTAFGGSDTFKCP